MVFRFGLFLCACIAVAIPAAAKDYLVKTQSEYFAAEKKIKAGDIITLANGEWRDFEIKFSGRGKKSRPITLRAEDAGKVILVGQSNLRIGGKIYAGHGVGFQKRL